MAKRANNFTSLEVNTLLDSVEAKKHILENKKTDRVTVEEKKTAWKEIADSFNSSFVEYFRTEKVFITKYQNIKRTAKSNFAFDRRQSYKTGGGSKSRSAITYEDNRIVAICQAEQLEGSKAIYDDENQNMRKLFLEYMQETFDSIVEIDNSFVGDEANENDAAEVDLWKWKQQCLMMCSQRKKAGLG